MVEQASNKTKNASYSARQGVSQGQKPYTQTTFFSLRKFPFPRSTVSRTVWLRSAVSPCYARSDNRSALSDNLSYFPTISESETFSRKKSWSAFPFCPWDTLCLAVGTIILTTHWFISHFGHEWYRNESTCAEKKSNPWNASSKKDTIFGQSPQRCLLDFPPYFPSDSLRLP